MENKNIMQSEILLSLACFSLFPFYLCVRVRRWVGDLLLGKKKLQYDKKGRGEQVGNFMNFYYYYSKEAVWVP